MLYSFGETNGFLNWLVVSYGVNGKNISSVAVIESSNGKQTAELTWNGALIKLNKNSNAIYDTTKNISIKFGPGVTVKSIEEEISKNGIDYDFKIFQIE